MVWGQQGVLESVRFVMEDKECCRLTECGGGADAEGDGQAVWDVIWKIEILAD